MNETDLASGAVVITGAGSGIGLGIATEAASRGLNLVLADVSEQRLSEAADELAGYGSQILAVRTDVTIATDVDALADAAYERFGRVSLLVNNAGIESYGYMWETPVEEWTKVVQVNLLGVFHGIHSFLSRMGSDTRPAQIVNTASLASVGMHPKMSAYIASKHAVQSLTESLFLECQDKFPHLGVAVLNPGEVQSRIFEDVSARAETSEELQVFRSRLREHGQDPRDLARILFEAILRDEFWILPDRDFFEFAALGRSKYLAELSVPEMPSLPDTSSES